MQLSSVTWPAGAAVVEAADGQDPSMHPRSILVLLDHADLVQCLDLQPMGALCINTGGWQEWQGSNLRPPVLEFAGCRPKQSSRMPIWLICSALVSAFDCLIPPRRCRKPWPTTLIYIEREEIEGWPRKTRIVRHRPSKARRAAATARSKIEVLLEMT